MLSLSYKGFKFVSGGGGEILLYTKAVTKLIGFVHQNTLKILLNVVLNLYNF